MGPHLCLLEAEEKVVKVCVIFFGRENFSCRGEKNVLEFQHVEVCVWISEVGGVFPNKGGEGVRKELGACKV